MEANDLACEPLGWENIDDFGLTDTFDIVRVADVTEKMVSSEYIQPVRHSIATQSTRVLRRRAATLPLVMGTK